MMASILKIKESMLAYGSMLTYLAVLIAGILIGYTLNQAGLGTALLDLRTALLDGDIVGKDSEWFWTMTQAMIVLVSLVAIYRQIQLQRSSNALQLLVELRQEWYSKKMVRYRKGVCDQYPVDIGKEMTNAETEVANFFENLGLFHKKRTIPTDLIWELYSVHIENIWPMLKERINRLRTTEGDPTILSNFQDLLKAMQEYSKDKGAPSKDKNEDDIGRYVSASYET